MKNVLIIYVFFFLEYLVANYFFSQFMYKKEHRKLVFVLTGIVCALVKEVVLFNVSPVGVIIFGFLIYYAVEQLIYDKAKMKKIALSLMFVSVSLLTTLVINFLLITLEITTVLVTIDLIDQYVLMSILSLILLSVLIFTLSKVFGCKANDLEGKTLVPIVLYSSVVLILIGLLLNQKESSFIAEGNLFILIFLIFLLAVGILIAFLYSTLVYTKDMEIENLQNTHYRSAYRQQQTHIEHVNKLVHEFDNQILLLQSMYETAPLQAHKLGIEILSSSEKYKSEKLVEVKNIAVTCLLDKLRSACKDRNIELTTKIYTDDLSFISFMDASIIFDNLINNALEACNSNDIINKKIDLLIKKKNTFTSIVITNSCCNETSLSNNFLLSRKRGFKEIGIGHQNINAVAEKYGGFAKFEILNEVFKVHVILNSGTCSGIPIETIAG